MLNNLLQILSKLLEKEQKQLMISSATSFLIKLHRSQELQHILLQTKLRMNYKFTKLQIWYRNTKNKIYISRRKTENYWETEINILNNNNIKMKYQKTINLLGNTPNQLCKFGRKRMEHGTYNPNSWTKVKTTMLK